MLSLMLLTALAVPTVPISQEAVTEGAWRVTVSRDAMTDQLRTTAETEVDGNFLSVVCDRRLYMGISTTEYLGSGPAEIGRNLVFRVDDEPLYSRPGRWNYGTDLAVNSTGVPEMVARWRDGRAILVRLTRFDNTNVDLTFSLEGAQPALDRVFAACGAVVPPKPPPRD